MGRKKKSRNDARGYGQQQGKPTTSSKTNTSAAAPVVSSKTHDGLKDLLGQLGGEPATFSNGNAESSNRFVSKLTSIVHRLQELGFSAAQVEKVAIALGYDLTLESCLDWLCLHSQTLELPALFTDGRVRDSLMTVTTEDSLTVLKLDTPPPADRNEIPLLSAESVQVRSKGSEDDEQIRKQEEEEAAKQKAWLLQQYQYEDDGGEGDDLTCEKVNKEADTIVDLRLTPEEEYLLEKENELKALEVELNNEANNYMRSKYETKQLQSEAKRLRQQVSGLRKKVEKSKAKQQQKEVEEVAAVAVSQEQGNGEEEEDYSGAGLFDMFGGGEGNETTAVIPEPDKPSLPLKKLDYCIPKEWTGTTPQKTLDEICRKQKLPKPKYSKLPRNSGFRLAVTLKKKQNVREWRAETKDFVKGSSLQDYMAIQALYEMDPSLPLYRMLPPAFRDLWLSWQNQQKEAQTQVQHEHDTAKREQIERLLSLIAAKGNTQTVSAKPATPKSEKEEKDLLDEEFVHDNWDDGESDEETRVDEKKPISSLGSQIRDEFVRRQGSKGYKDMLEIRSSLPMTSYRQQILDTVQSHPVTILCAETGAGKTTQCPQYLLEEALSDGRGDSVQIICTQPRRVAATSVAERVAEEMCDTLGKGVGYQIRMEAKRSEQTKLLFCTTGIILRRLQDDSSLTGISHVIVDEVHERQQQTDVLLVTLRQLLRTTRPDLKVILMSATLDSNLFRNYFDGAPVISVPGRTFPVTSYYLEDLMDATNHIIEEGSRYALREMRYGDIATLQVTTRGGEKRREVVDLVSQTDVSEVSDLYPGYKMSTRRSMDRVNEEVINYDLIEDVLNLLLIYAERNTILTAPDGADMSKGSILVFLPGLGEIRSMTERLQGNRALGDSKRFEIIPMHSALSSQDQRRAFVPAKEGRRKIILSTNIAETSVTIPDVVCVIDCGRVREVRRNKRTSTSILVTDWCSRASAKQRAGRAGRVQPGLCLKLYSSRTAQIVMKTASEPELRRIPLEEVCLSILASGFSTSCMEFLSQAPQPPTDESVQAAINVLDEVGAIKFEENARTKRNTERLTPLGQHLAKLPVDVRLGKMLIFGAMFKCLDKVLTIAAALSSQSPFSTFVADANVAKAKQKAFADADSDFLTLCAVWDAYAAAAATSSSAGRKFCRANYLNFVALREIGDARRQFLDLLCSIGFVERKAVIGANSRVDFKILQTSKFNENADKPELLHAVICAGLYPNVAHLQQPTAGDYSMWHKEERLYFHNSSVNSSRKRFSSSENWVVFHEKFGTPKRVSVSTTSFVHPFSLILLGGSVSVKHIERLVVVDDWIQIGLAAQIGVIMRELRKQVDLLLQKMIENVSATETDKMCSNMVQGIVNILGS